MPTALRGLEMPTHDFFRALLVGLFAIATLEMQAHAAGNVERGAQASRNCVACHSFAAGRQLTGPSLAGIWGKKAGRVDGFGRYSEALKASDVVWEHDTLDAWLRSPSAFIPGNTMPFGGIPDPAVRADLIAYLQAVSSGKVSVPDRGPPDLKRAEVFRQVVAIRYCADAYRVTTGDGKNTTWWEFNLRFKTDGGPNGPESGKPVIVGNGMQGDRAAIVFSRPEEISSLVRRECP
jgi:cytochrome c